MYLGSKLNCSALIELLLEHEIALRSSNAHNELILGGGEKCETCRRFSLYNKKIKVFYIYAYVFKWNLPKQFF